ncbi:MAG: hypothetical protein LQ340_003540 [Diploschistes diacapsis]|nr:MAG: hypothetical protein LQ340_003540 [Diploschistes diacapsis]
MDLYIPVLQAWDSIADPKSTSVEHLDTCTSWSQMSVEAAELLFVVRESLVLTIEEEAQYQVLDLKNTYTQLRHLGRLSECVTQHIIRFNLGSVVNRSIQKVIEHIQFTNEYVDIEKIQGHLSLSLISLDCFDVLEAAPWVRYGTMDVLLVPVKDNRSFISPAAFPTHVQAVQYRDTISFGNTSFVGREGDEFVIKPEYHRHGRPLAKSEFRSVYYELGCDLPWLQWDYADSVFRGMIPITLPHNQPRFLFPSDSPKIKSWDGKLPGRTLSIIIKATFLEGHEKLGLRLKKITRARINLDVLPWWDHSRQDPWSHASLRPLKRSTRVESPFKTMHDRKPTNAQGDVAGTPLMDVFQAPSEGQPLAQPLEGQLPDFPSESLKPYQGNWLSPKMEQKTTSLPEVEPEWPVLEMEQEATPILDMEQEARPLSEMEREAKLTEASKVREKPPSLRRFSFEADSERNFSARKVEDVQATDLNEGLEVVHSSLRKFSFEAGSDRNFSTRRIGESPVAGSKGELEILHPYAELNVFTVAESDASAPCKDYMELPSRRASFKMNPYQLRTPGQKSGNVRHQSPSSSTDTDSLPDYVSQDLAIVNHSECLSIEEVVWPCNSPQESELEMHIGGRYSPLVGLNSQLVPDSHTESQVLADDGTHEDPKDSQGTREAKPEADDHEEQPSYVCKDNMSPTQNLSVTLRERLSFSVHTADAAMREMQEYFEAESSRRLNTRPVSPPSISTLSMPSGSDSFGSADNEGHVRNTDSFRKSSEDRESQDCMKVFAGAQNDESKQDESLPKIEREEASDISDTDSYEALTELEVDEYDPNSSMVQIRVPIKGKGKDKSRSKGSGQPKRPRKEIRS